MTEATEHVYALLAERGPMSAREVIRLLEDRHDEELRRAILEGLTGGRLMLDPERRLVRTKQDNR